nr:hypothetical protein [Spiroplasma endosymbiont of Lariophagus distinguendus]
MHKNYPSHVTKEQFENIRSILENSKKKTKPRNLDLYEVLNLSRKVDNKSNLLLNFIK